MNRSPAVSSTDIGPFQIAVLIMSVLALAALAADTVCDLPPAQHHLIQIFDTAVCVVLLTDFFVRLHQAKSKREFMKWGWIDLIASIPNVDVLRWGRLVRVLRVIRLLRGIRATHRVLTMILEKKMRAGSVSLGLMAFLLITFSSGSILVCEQRSDANIKSAVDAVWWSITTITTVGYGDRYPVTTEGRVVGILLMVCGVGMFGAISGMVAALFLGGQQQKPAGMEEILAHLEQLQAKLDGLAGDRKPSAEGGRGSG